MTNDRTHLFTALLCAEVIENYLLLFLPLTILHMSLDHTSTIKWR